MIKISLYKMMIYNNWNKKFNFLKNKYKTKMISFKSYKMKISNLDNKLMILKGKLVIFKSN